MSAEVLRRAASLMRERAQTASESRWSDGGAWWEHWTDPEGRKCHTPWPTVTRGTGAEIVAKTTSEADAAHIASWHSAVALAVADWLDRAALTSPPDPHGKGEGCPDCESYWLALAVARAYLGEQP